MISEVAKKLLSMTDTKSLSFAIAQLLDMKGLSRDLVVTLTDRASKQKELVLQTMANEFSSFLSKINITEEAQKIMDGMTLTIEAKIHFPDDRIQPESIHITSKPKKKAAKKDKKVSKTDTKKKQSVRRSRKK